MKTWAVLGFRAAEETVPAVIWHAVAETAGDAEQVVRDGDPGSAEYVIRAHATAIRGTHSGGPANLYRGPWSWDRL
ncbi:hypothetical protein [Azospirillum soli]|uniref:hypothetical protein n=1 Tax=Azospirillum soli TaxID=1304799 RepID=UPI001AE45176|nr:hypothetical protein [Azospirillum soli]MBP2315522.1 hypothetical protein [Azospirillum soli]